MTYGKRLIALRAKWGLTRTLFAKLTSLSYKTVEAWETSTRQPDTAAKAYIEALEDDQVFMRITGITKRESE